MSQEDKFKKVGIGYEHRLIDDIAVYAKSYEGLLSEFKNYDGNIQPDVVVRGFGSLGLMTSIIKTSNGDLNQTGAVYGIETINIKLIY